MVDLFRGSTVRAQSELIRAGAAAGPAAGTGPDLRAERARRERAARARRQRVQGGAR